MATKTITCIPMGENVLVDLIMEAKSEGGLVLPEKQANYGIVKAIGCAIDKEKYLCGTDKSRNARGLQVGDRVFLPRGDSGNKISPTLRLMPINFIAAIMPEPK